MAAHPQPRQKARMRTVFTDAQTKQLEALFELTDYPTVEARAGVARSTGLGEETIRVSPTRRHQAGVFGHNCCLLTVEPERTMIPESNKTLQLQTIVQLKTNYLLLNVS